MKEKKITLHIMNFLRLMFIKLSYLVNIFDNLLSTDIFFFFFSFRRSVGILNRETENFIFLEDVEIRLLL